MKTRKIVQRTKTTRTVPREKIALVGAGSVGSALLAALVECGHDATAIVSRSPKPALTLAKALGCKRVYTAVCDLPKETSLLILAVPDDVLTQVATECALAKRLVFNRLLVIHTSGVHTVEVLNPLKRRGASVASLHPVQSFPRTQSLRARVLGLRGITFGFEGQGKILSRVEGLIKELGGRLIEIESVLKPLYHIMCVFASNYVVALLNAVQEVGTAAGIGSRWRDVMLPLFTTSVENALRTTPAEALTGPVMRGDFETITKHLKALSERAPQMMPFYSIAAIEVGRIARRNGILAPEQFRDLVARIGKETKNLGETTRIK